MELLATTYKDKISGVLICLDRTIFKVIQNIIDQEINVTGSGSLFESWYHGKEQQTRPTFHTIETCLMTIWMKVNYDLLTLTGKSLYADNLEHTYYSTVGIKSFWGFRDCNVQSAGRFAGRSQSSVRNRN